MTEGKRNQKQSGFDVKTFPVPFALENINITINATFKPPKEELINQAIKLHLEGNIKEAAKHYQYLIDQGLNEQRVFTNYAVILKNHGKLEEAETLYRKAIELNPKYAKAHSNLGNILRELGKLEEAESSQRKAIELNPDFAIAHSNLGSILNDLGKLEEAESSQRKAIELNPVFAEAHYNLGNILNARYKFKEAELSQRKAIELNPNLAEAHSSLGSILRDLGKSKEAELSQRKAIELKPDFAMAHLNLGSILNDLGELAEAELSTRKAIELNPDYAEAYSILGNILSSLGNLKAAELSQLKAIKHDPDNQTIKSNLLNLLTIYEAKNINTNPLYKINKEFKDLSLRKQDNYLITDGEAIQIYKDGLEIYKKYNLDLETYLSQVYKCNEINLNCKRHMLIFNQKKIIPEFCFGCYKVQVEVDSIIELIKLFLVFNSLELKNYNTRKCMIELRPNVSGFYKGLIYCLGLNEALEISKNLDTQIQTNIRIDLISKVKRGCSEYPLEFPQYKEINISGDQPMNYNENWRSIEKEIDRGNKNWGKSTKSLEGFNLNNFLIMRNWIAYAQKIGDQSVNKITNEQIKGPKIINYLNREFQSKQTQKTTIYPTL